MMLVEIKCITKCGSYHVWETEVLGRKVEVWQKQTKKPQLMDLALNFAFDDCNLSVDEFINPVINGEVGDRLIISSIPLSVTINFCKRKLSASLTGLIGSAQRDLQAYALIERYGKPRIERVIRKLSERSEQRSQTTRLERDLMSVLSHSLETEAL